MKALCFKSLATFAAPRFAASGIHRLSYILAGLANAHIGARVRTGVAIASHNVLSALAPPLFPFAALKPNLHPLLKCKQEWDAAGSCASLVKDVSGFGRLLGALPSVTLARKSSRFLKICLAPLSVSRGFGRAIGVAPFAHILFALFAVSSRPRAVSYALPLLPAIFGFSHWLHSQVAMVRGGIGADTSVPFRLYHTLPAGQS